MHGCSYLPGRISVVRCNSSSASTHRLHQRADEMAWILGTLEAVLPTGDGVISDRLPVPVYRQVRARRGRKVRRRAYCGSCAANRETFVGWRVHVVCRLDGVPVRVQMLPAGVHNLTPVHELAYGLPAGARLLGDNAYNSAADEASTLAETGVRLVPMRRANMRPHAWFMDVIALRAYRHTIETVNSQLEKMGAERLPRGANAVFELKTP